MIDQFLLVFDKNIMTSALSFVFINNAKKAINIGSSKIYNTKNAQWQKVGSDEICSRKSKNAHNDSMFDLSENTLVPKLLLA